ncbi:MAG TPA: hypothetical protein VHW43_06615 [Puia sp.]|nr:hypothetical protein [Puia sp.]
MIKVFSLLLFALFLCCCKDKNRGTVAIWIENNSDVNKNIEIATYLGDSMVDKRIIMKDSISDRILLFRIQLKLPVVERQHRIRFVLPATKEETSCLVMADSLSETDLLHVNYVERIFKRGSQFENVTLGKDRVYDKRFDCEVIHHSSR